MLNLFLKSVFAKLSDLKVGILLSLALVTGATAPLLAYSAHKDESARSERTYLVASSLLEKGVEKSSTSEELPQEGKYVYGRSPQPEQIGSEYLVFQVREDNKVVGAFYMPASEFDCFYGSIEKRQMKLAVVSSYEETTHPVAIALESQSTTADNAGQTPPTLALEGYHRLEDLSENDLRMLNTCIQNHSQKVWN